MAQFSPQIATGQIPSGFYLTDALLALDRKMQGALLTPVTGETKQDVAACESKRLKRLMSGLRHLYRNCFLSSLVFCFRNVLGSS